MTTPTPTTPLQLPAFEPQTAGESLAAYGQRAMRYALQLQTACFARLDDVALEAAGHAVTHALAMKGHADHTVACLVALQRELRSRLTARQADRAAGLQALQTWLDAQPVDTLPPADGAQASPADGPQGPQGGGGAKVRQPTRPKSPAPAGWAPLPALDLADAF